ncbi:MAG: cytochrome d ubiquinol oxidase subunit II [Deltaproteobacteria bacterium]|nr:cytochrome d ubiquinol oxidase subunit II [Deltaproteobacteria bacterium]
MAAGGILVSLILYALLGGADFGGGVWGLLGSGPRAGAQRLLIAHAIGPIWETNHIWVVIAVVILFTAFPPAFALISTALFVPVTLMLAGIVLRGAAFAFHSYHLHDEGGGMRRWGSVFACASLLTPVLLGVVIGAVSSGSLRAQSTAPLGASAAWLSPFPFSVGLLTLAVFSYLAGLVFLAATAALGAHVSLLLRSYPVARICAAAQAIVVLAGWGGAQYPFLVRPDLTIPAAASSHASLRLILIALAAGGVLLFPAIFLLFWVFKKEAVFGRSRKT